MARTDKWRMGLIAVMGVAMVMVGDTEAQSTPPGSSGCTNSLVSLYPCFAFITGNGSFSRPSESCCSGLATVVKISTACVCQLIGTTNNSLGIPINRTMALSLPGACNITTRPLSQCNKAAGAPADAPASSPGSSPASPTAASPGADSPSSSLFPSTNIPPTNSDKGNIPAASPRASSGVVPIFTPSMMMRSSLLGMIAAIMTIGW